MAMSVPAPTEKLRSAAASAGESLMPSLVDQRQSSSARSHEAQAAKHSTSGQIS